LDIEDNDVLAVCKAIYQLGERYEDGTAAIDFGDLFQVTLKTHTLLKSGNNELSGLFL